MAMRELLTSGIILLVAAGCAAMDQSTGLEDFQPDGVVASATNDPPGLMREARGLWVASVANIDWPSKPGLPVAQQKDELIKLFDKAVELNMNVIVLQVRPAADALYDSKLEPWSAYLTGEQGVAPKPYYDPLAFAVEEAHARGLELHAWFNPFRAMHPAKPKLAKSHVKNTHPDWVVKYGEYLWLDPSNEAANKHSLDVIADVVKRYDIDGVHVDDYFYPYPIDDAKGKRVEFPDDKNWKAYQAKGGKLSRSDWRRDHINQFMKDMYSRTKAIKPWVKVGISPFGIWRPGNPPQIKGFDAYEKLYADAKLWLQEGWVDYFTPQLYWPIDQKPQSYPVLMNWWIEQNTKGRAIWPGLFTSKLIQGNSGWNPDEIKNQVLLTQEAAGAEGNIHFSAKAVMRSNKLAKDLSETYALPALVPAMPWLSKSRAKTPKVMVEETNDGMQLKLRAVDVPAANGWVVAFRTDGDALSYQILPGTTATVKLQVPLEDVRVATVNRYGMLSKWVAPALGK